MALTVISSQSVTTLADTGTTGAVARTKASHETLCMPFLHVVPPYVVPPYFVPPYVGPRGDLSGTRFRALHH
jgi:hypothetical protein